ncbi:MAG: type 1 glutamine amidotransferase domain-containing protein [Bacilli bacterium]
MKKILVVVTNVAKYETTERPTGLWLGEAVHFVHVMEEAGYSIDYASAKGGYTPIDPHSLSNDFMTPTDWKYYTDHHFMNLLGNTIAAKDVDPSQYDAVYFTGGHGVMWDFPEDSTMQSVVRDIYENGGVVSAVCHGVAGLLNIKLADGINMIDGVTVTGFANSEERAIGLDTVVPFLTEDELTKRGGRYVQGDDWAPFAVTDRRIVTGQNPASGSAVAQEVLKLLQK